MMKKTYTDPELLIEAFTTEEVLASTPGIDEDDLDL